jgi:hypothetical protein
MECAKHERLLFDMDRDLLLVRGLYRHAGSRLQAQ